MAVHLFNNSPIFGFPTSQTGPRGNYRAQEEQLPGVSGIRLYQLGRNPEVWKIRGRLTAPNLVALRLLISAGKSWVNGQLYNFTDSSGRVYNNCQLMSFNPIGPYEGCILVDTTPAVTVEIDAEVRWCVPVGSGL